jgi:hypothetical protein
MSDGQLLVRVRAHEREKAWGPAYVANELAGTRQAVAHRRQEAAMRRAEADAAIDEDERARLVQEATEADALAEVLGQRAAELAVADEVRAGWFAHTAATRAAADRAQVELTARRVDAAEQPQVTSEEWLTAHAEHLAAEDEHREVTDEADLADVVEDRGADVAAVAPQPHDDAAETAVGELREVTADEEPAQERDEVRVPSAEETADTIARAQRALREIEQRQAVEARHTDEEAQAVELSRRNVEDVAEQQVADDSADVLAR